MPDRRHYYLNALFDLELGGYCVDAVKRSAAEMTTLFLPLLQPEDTINIEVGLPTEYSHPAYLRSCGFATPEISTGVSLSPSDVLPEMVAWGWNQQAVERLGIAGTTAAASLDVVRSVNCRRFCSEVARQHGTGVPGSRFFDTPDGFDEVAHHGSFPLVIKPAFGGAGFGLRVVQSAGAWPMERCFFETYLSHGGCVIESWCERVLDLSTSVYLRRDGSSTPVVFQRQWVNRFGSFYGMYSTSDDPLISPWCTELERVTLLLARCAAQHGYFGPLGIDSFVYRDRWGVERLAAGIEVNGRFTMGMLAHELRRQIAPDRHTLLRFAGKKRCRLPATIEAWNRLCGAEMAFSPATGCGIMLISPLRVCYCGVWSQPQRNVFFIVGDSLEQVEQLDRKLRTRFSTAGSVE